MRRFDRCEDIWLFMPAGVHKTIVTASGKKRQHKGRSVDVFHGESQIVVDCAEPLQIDDLGEIIKINMLLDDQKSLFEARQDTAACLLETAHPVDTAIPRRDEEPPGGLGLDEQAHQAALFMG